MKRLEDIFKKDGIKDDGTRYKVLLTVEMTSKRCPNAQREEIDISEAYESFADAFEGIWDFVDFYRSIYGEQKAEALSGLNKRS
jgi:hypothetical protein